MRALLTEPSGVPADVQERFEAAFSPAERLHVAAAMKGMFVVNLANNSGLYAVARLRGADDTVQGDACPIRSAE